MVPAPLDVTSQNDAIALWEACGLTRRRNYQAANDPAADFARAIAGPGSAILGFYLARGYMRSEVTVLQKTL